MCCWTLTLFSCCERICQMVSTFSSYLNLDVWSDNEGIETVQLYMWILRLTTIKETIMQENHFGALIVLYGMSSWTRYVSGTSLVRRRPVVIGEQKVGDWLLEKHFVLFLSWGLRKGERWATWVEEITLSEVSICYSTPVVYEMEGREWVMKAMCAPSWWLVWVWCGCGRFSVLLHHACNRQECELQVGWPWDSWKICIDPTCWKVIGLCVHVVTSYLDSMKDVILTLAFPLADKDKMGVRYDFIVSLLM